jgi:hypothetical protein
VVGGPGGKAGTPEALKVAIQTQPVVIPGGISWRKLIGFANGNQYLAVIYRGLRNIGDNAEGERLLVCQSSFHY